MTISLTCAPTPEYLRFEVTGARGAQFAEEMADIWRRIAQECAAGGHARVLGISRLTGPVSKAALFRVGQVAPPLLREAGCRRLAYVVLGGDAALQALKFGENVAVNRGQLTRVFDDEAAAIAWLTSA